MKKKTLTTSSSKLLFVSQTEEIYYVPCLFFNFSQTLLNFYIQIWNDEYHQIESGNLELIRAEGLNSLSEDDYQLSILNFIICRWFKKYLIGGQNTKYHKSSIIYTY